MHKKAQETFYIDYTETPDKYLCHQTNEREDSVVIL